MEMSSLLRRRFNASAKFHQTGLERYGADQHNCDTIFHQIVLIGLKNFLSTAVYPR